jgi:hypothetical protein
MITNETTYLKANITNSTNIKRKLFEGEEHLVIPVVAAKEMVMNGYFYPAKEFSDWVDTWEGVPVPINHPKQNNQPVSARSPRIQEVTSVGHFFDVKFNEKNELVGNIYINLNKIKKLNAEYLIDKFESGEIVEVSTGLYSNIENKTGVFNGVEYIGIIRNIRPDHLALLPNEIGACSIADGCGAKANYDCSCSSKESSCSCNGHHEESLKDKILEVLKTINIKKLFANESYKDKQKLIYEALRNIYDESVFIIDFYEDTVIYELHSERKMYKRSYKYDPEKYQYNLEDDIIEVVQKTKYEEKINGGKLMENKEEELVELVTNEEKSDQPITNEADVAVAEEEEKVEQQEESVQAEEVVEEVAEEAVEETAEAVINSIKSNELKAEFEIAYSEFKLNKESITKNIISNSTFTANELKEYSYNSLKKLNENVGKKEINFVGNNSAIVESKQVYKPASIFDK